MLGTKEKKAAQSFLQRLRSNTAGNTLAMAAMSLFPIIGLVGGGVDIGRAYMAKARLQQACDAGALAGRRNMTQDTMTSEDIAEANKFFEFNFPEGSFASTPFDETVVDSDGKEVSVNEVVFEDGSDPRVVDGKAQTTIQTTLMRVFNFEHMVVSVDCTSRLDVGNVDVMMVLDVTGSMGNTVSDGGTRLEALQGAVEDFYNILGPGGGASGEQIRYGFVPYSSTVNVGRILYNENPEWVQGGQLDQRATYQTRKATWEYPDINHPDYSRTSVPDNPEFSQLNQVDGPECTDRFPENLQFGGNYFNPNPSGNPVLISENRQDNVITRVTREYEYVSWNGSTNQPPANAVGPAFWEVCVRKASIVTEVIPIIQSDKWEPGSTMVTSWNYAAHTHNVHDYVRSIDPNNPAAQRPTTNGLQLDRWDGCIEERQTVTSITTGTTSIPNDALDLKIDLLPSDAESRWKPFWLDIIYDRNNSSSGWEISKGGDLHACPSEARRLQSYPVYDDGTSDDLQSYIDGLQDQGFTNHTIGMIWGARLLSAEGLFAATNASSTNGFNIGRHIVFMTDGGIDIRPTNYGAYGYQRLDGRITAPNATEATLESLQAQRFQLMCAAARAKGWTIWVVQFGVTTVTPNMENCATTPANATAATNKAELEAAFSGIAQKIGGLRLSN